MASAGGGGVGRSRPDHAENVLAAVGHLHLAPAARGGAAAPSSPPGARGPAGPPRGPSPWSAAGPQITASGETSSGSDWSMLASSTEPGNPDSMASRSAAASARVGPLPQISAVSGAALRSAASSSARSRRGARPGRAVVGAQGRALGQLGQAAVAQRPVVARQPVAHAGDVDLAPQHGHVAVAAVEHRGGDPVADREVVEDHRIGRQGGEVAVDQDHHDARPAQLLDRARGGGAVVGEQHHAVGVPGRGAAQRPPPRARARGCARWPGRSPARRTRRPARTAGPVRARCSSRGPRRSAQRRSRTGRARRPVGHEGPAPAPAHHDAVGDQLVERADRGGGRDPVPLDDLALGDERLVGRELPARDRVQQLLLDPREQRDARRWGGGMPSRFSLSRRPSCPAAEHTAHGSHPVGTSLTH